MHFSTFTIASVALAATGSLAIDVAEVPGYEPVPKAATNKYAADTAPNYATGGFEPTYMPEEDLHPTPIAARSVAPSSSSAQPTISGPADESYEAFVEWMNARLGPEGAEDVTHSHVARSVVTSSSATAQPTISGPADGSWEAFVDWMNSRPGAAEKAAPSHVARSETSSSATAQPTLAGPADESWEAFVEWMNTHVSPKVAETAHSHVARDAPAAQHSTDATTDASADHPADESYEAFVAWMSARESQLSAPVAARSVAPSAETAKAAAVETPKTASAQTPEVADGPEDESYEAFVHWMNARGGYAAGDEDELLHARSDEQAHANEEVDWEQLWQTVYARSLQGAEAPPSEEEIAARFAEDDDEDEPEEYYGLYAEPIHQGSSIEHETFDDEDFEAFIARHHAEAGAPSEAQGPQSQPQSQTAVDADTSASTPSASPAAAPTPKPTSAVASSAVFTPTSASQWSDMASETAISAISEIKAQARSVSSHFRFRHQSTTATISSSLNAAAAASTETASSSSTSRRGFFNLPW